MFSRALYELLSKMLDHLDSNEKERYTQHSRTINKLDRVIELLENDSHVDTHEAQQSDKLKATINVDTTETVKAIKQMRSDIDDIRLQMHASMIPPDVDHESFYDVSYDDVFVRQFKSNKQKQRDFVKGYVETVNQFIYEGYNDTGKVSKLHLSNDFQQCAFVFDADQYSYQLPKILNSLGNRITKNDGVQAFVFLE